MISFASVAWIWAAVRPETSVYVVTNQKFQIFFGTPHRGSDKIALAELVSKAAKIAFQNPNDKLIEALSRDSQILEHQRKSFSSISKDLPMVCIAEEKPVSIGLVGRNIPQTSILLTSFGRFRSSLNILLQSMDFMLSLGASLRVTAICANSKAMRT